MDEGGKLSVYTIDAFTGESGFTDAALGFHIQLVLGTADRKRPAACWSNCRGRWVDACGMTGAGGRSPVNVGNIRRGNNYSL